MGMIGRWIDQKCETHPDVMRRVLGRRFGRLERFIMPDGKCGCLIGSWGLESGGARAWYVPMSHPSDRAPEYEVGMRVLGLTRWRAASLNWFTEKRPDAFVIRLLKQRIRKSLGIAPENRPDEPSVIIGQLESVSR